LVAVPSIGRASQVTPRRAAAEADMTRELYERYARQIYSYCLHQLGNREEAEDATQSTFLNAFRGLQRGVDPEFESAWLYKIAQNVCLTRQRSSSRRRRVETPGDLEAMQDYVPAHQADSDELIRLPEALESMPEQQRRALLLREWQGLSYKEIAEELDVSQAAVETLLFRARRTLASGLEEAPPKKASAARRRLRRSGDAGSLLAILKSIFFAGGAKVAATMATVEATTVVAASPAARHAVEAVVAPADALLAPVHHVAKAAAKKPAVTHAAVSAAAALAPAATRSLSRPAVRPAAVSRRARLRCGGRRGRMPRRRFHRRNCGR
jgi:RNA polymerase sigma factor (sigma-70 family)